VILYTIIPEELIFGKYEENFDNQKVELEYMGEKVVVTPLSNNEFVIDRLISTSPKAYLNPKLQPGIIIKGKI